MLDGIQNSPSYLQNAVHQQLADTGVAGSYRGQQVAVVDLHSLIAENAEEMTFFKSETMERKSLSERKGKSSETDLQRLRELAELLIRQIPDLGDRPKLDQFVESLLRNRPRDRDALKRETEGEFGDISQQYAALLYSAESLKAKGTPESIELAGLASSLAEELMTGSRSEVIAGLNISIEAVRFADTGLDSPQGLRDLYRTVVVGHGNALSAFDSLMGRYGSAKFDDGVRFLIESIGRERGLNETSAPIEELEASVNDLYFVQFIGNSDSVMRSLLERVDRNFLN